MASSSSATDSHDHYDVFLSFRGTDTRNNFTSHLYKALCDNNVKAFIDNSINRGEKITLSLEGIIEAVKLSIIVFSSDYASSTFCLDEMVKIIECKKTKAHIVLPIFYKVYPSKEIYKEAFARHEEVIDQEMKVEGWRSSFQKTLELAGWHIDDNRNEATVIEEITRDVLKKLNCQFEGEMKSTPLVGQTSENYLEKVMQCLMNAENSKVGVWGMGGVGKTTIVTHINNILLNDASFSRQIYWVTVSRDAIISKLQREIAKLIQLDLSGIDNESKRAAKLFNELKRINKFVLILDDVWEPFEVEEVGISLTGGQKLLLTTRDLGVCRKMMCQQIEVKPLFEHEAVDLFMKESRINISDSREWREIVHSIVKECAGLPLAIIVVARTMRGVVEIRQWRNTLRELQKPHEGENHEMKEKVFKVLKFSYDRLPSDMHRQCFLYCSLFPEDHNFSEDDLIECWIGMGIIDALDSRQAELDKGNAILDELIQSSLLEDNTEYIYRQIKMHDVIRDMARVIIKVESQFQDSLGSVLVMNDAMIKSFPNSTPHCSKIKTLILDDYCEFEVSDSFFGNMQSLNVLIIIGEKSIPDSITNLRNLKMLIITYNYYMECISSIAGLERLQHLKMSYNEELREIPKGIETLVNLKVLDLSKNMCLRGYLPNSVLEKLSHLQILNLIGSRIEVEPKGIISLDKLEILKLNFYSLQKHNCYVKSGHWRRLLKYQINYGAYDAVEDSNKGMVLKAIEDAEKWKGESGIFLTDDIQYLHLVHWKSPMFHVLKNPPFAHLRAICFSHYESRYLFNIDSAQQFLHNIQQLYFRNCHDLEEIIATEDELVNQSNSINYPTIILPNLKMLSLCALFELRNIYRGRMDCPSLELIEIEFCEKLERLPFCMKKEGNKTYPSIKLDGWYHVRRSWWNSLEWDDPNDKSMYNPVFSSDNESVLEEEGESEVDAEMESVSEYEGETEVDAEMELETSGD